MKRFLRLLTIALSVLLLSSCVVTPRSRVAITITNPSIDEVRVSCSSFVDGDYIILPANSSAEIYVYAYDGEYITLYANGLFYNNVRASGRVYLSSAYRCILEPNRALLGIQNNTGYTIYHIAFNNVYATYDSRLNYVSPGSYLFNNQVRYVLLDYYDCNLYGRISFRRSGSTAEYYTYDTSPMAGKIKTITLSRL